MSWETLLAIEIVVTAGTVWSGHYSCVCEAAAFLRLAVVVLTFIARCR
ncbi:MAG: hypothetical protein WBV36_24765 [Terriglobales bacterium]